MAEQDYAVLTRESLRHRLATEEPDNKDPDKGYALVNVLDPEAFEDEHIPSSVNIPAGNEDEFERRFSKDKEIVVYCASHDCDASPKVAERLTERGFTNVYDFEGGMAAWKEKRYPVESGSSAAA